jgi:hypothetical protein
VKLAIGFNRTATFAPSQCYGEIRMSFLTRINAKLFNPTDCLR